MRPGTELSEFEEKVETILKQLQDCVSEYVRGYIASELKRSRIPSPQDIGVFTKREREVLFLVAKGCSNKEVGTTLNISERTAKFHVASILRKTGARSRTALASQYQSAWSSQSNNGHGPTLMYSASR